MTGPTGGAAEAGQTAPDRPGKPLNRRSPYVIGALGAAGVATTYGLVELLLSAREVLVLMGLALFLAIGLDSVVRLLLRWRLPRWLAITAVALAMLGVMGGFLAAVIPPLVTQGGQLVHDLPRHLHELQDRNSLIGRLYERFHLQQRAKTLAASDGQKLFGGLFGAGRTVLQGVAAIGTVLVLTVYFLIDLPRIRQLIYRFVPESRRPRAVRIGDEMFTKISRFLLGNLFTALIAGTGTFIWLVLFHVPYPLLLALMVALLAMVPVLGTTVAGIIVSLIALSVSVPVALATLAFYIAYRLAEDYLIVPRVVGKVVEVPATLTLVAVLLGVATLGVIGALVAVPVAATVRVLLQETVFPRLDRS